MPRSKESGHALDAKIGGHFLASSLRSVEAAGDGFGSSNSRAGGRR